MKVYKTAKIKLLLFYGEEAEKYLAKPANSNYMIGF